MFFLLLALVTALSWSEGRPLPRGVDHHGTFVTSGGWSASLHVIGGNDYQQQFATHWVADIASDGSLGAWHEGTALPAPTAGMAIAQGNLAIYVLGGQHLGRQNTTDVLVGYTGTRDAQGIAAWERGPALPAPRFHAAAVATDRFVYVLGGLETATSTNTIFRSRMNQDGTLGAWTTDTLPRARSHQAAFVHDGAIYMVGGLDGNPAGQLVPLWDVVRAEVHRDGSLGPWRTVGALDSAYATHAVFVDRDEVYVAGGVENNRRFSDAVQRAHIGRDGMLGPWERMAPLPTARGHVHQLPVLNGRVYSVGGSAGRTVIPDVFIGSLR